MPNAYSLRLLKGIYWYVRPSGSKWGFSTGWTINDFGTKKEVKRAIDGLPSDHSLWIRIQEPIQKENPKVQVFDIAKENPKKTVSEIISIYRSDPDKSGKDIKGNIQDEQKASTFASVVSSNLKKVELIFGKKCLDEISVQEIMNWIHQMEADGYANWSILKLLYTLSALFTYGMDPERGWCQQNLIPTSETIKKKRKKLETFANRKKVTVKDSEVEAMVEAYAKISRLSLLFFNLNLNVGGRCRELRTIQRKNIDLDAETITIQVHKAKVQVPRVINYGWSDSAENGNLVSNIKWFAQSLKPDDYLFSDGGKKPHTLTWAGKNFDKALKLAVEAERIDPIRAKTKVNGKTNEQRLTFRDFRHIAAQRMKKAGVALDDIAAELGTSVRLLLDVYLNEGAEARGERLKGKMKNAVSKAA